MLSLKRAAAVKNYHRIRVIKNTSMVAHNDETPMAPYSVQPFHKLVL